MRHPQIHSRTLGYLGRALSMEYSAVQLYMTQAALADRWGLTEAANRLRAETVEEMRHAERLVKRMLGVGAAPNASYLRPAVVAGDLLGLLEQDAVFEAEIVALYAEATGYCEQIGDRESADFFRGLWREEVDHATEIEEWRRSLGGDARESLNSRGLADERVYF